MVHVEISNPKLKANQSKEIKSTKNFHHLNVLEKLQTTFEWIGASKYNKVSKVNLKFSGDRAKGKCIKPAANGHIHNTPHCAFALYKPNRNLSSIKNCIVRIPFYYVVRLLLMLRCNHSKIKNVKEMSNKRNGKCFHEINKKR